MKVTRCDHDAHSQTRKTTCRESRKELLRQNYTGVIHNSNTVLLQKRSCNELCLSTNQEKSDFFEVVWVDIYTDEKIQPRVNNKKRLKVN